MLKRQLSTTTGRVCRTNAPGEKLAAAAAHTRGEKRRGGAAGATAGAANAPATRLEWKKVYIVVRRLSGSNALHTYRPVLSLRKVIYSQLLR